MTLQEAKSIARHLGLTLRLVRSGKYRVNFRDGNEVPQLTTRTISKTPSMLRLRWPGAPSRCDECDSGLASDSARAPHRAALGNMQLRSHLLDAGTATRGCWRMSLSSLKSETASGSRLDSSSSFNLTVPRWNPTRQQERRAPSAELLGGGFCFNGMTDSDAGLQTLQV